MIQKVISGGQTGADRAALDVALELGIPCGGWCPKGRKAEDGSIEARYPLEETPTGDYAQRTEWNVRDSDGTLVLTLSDVSGGTAQTIETARRCGRPCLVLDVAVQPDTSAICAWIVEHRIGVLNIAGPRESKCPGIYAASVAVLRQAFLSLQSRSLST